LALCVAGPAVPQQQAESIDYRFDEVKRKVVVTDAKQERRVQKGEHAVSGNKVQTGYFSYALLAAERYRAKFEIYSSSDVQLAEGTPGVILSVERGTIHAIFDKITGTEPRLVKTPGALLAVRGTQYTIVVGNDGHTMLDVFEGTVEVRSPLRPEPFLVHAGQESIFSRREMPRSQPMPKDRTPDGRNRAPQDGRQQQPHDGQHPPQGPRPQGPPPSGGHAPHP
jgi:hypothetical protein